MDIKKQVIIIAGLNGAGKTNTGIVIKKNGKIVEIPAAELKQQALAVKRCHLAEQDNK